MGKQAQKQKEEFNQVFTLPDGKEIKVADSYMGRYAKWDVQLIWADPELQHKNQLMHEHWANLDCKKVEKCQSFYDKETGGLCYAVVTSVIAENKSWVEYPTVKSYAGTSASNCEYYTKVEVLLMNEEYSRRLFLDWKGSLSFADCLEDLASNLWDAIEDELDSNGGKGEDSKLFAKRPDEYDFSDGCQLEFYNDDGDCVWISFECQEDLANFIVSARVIDFQYKIKK